MTQVAKVEMCGRKLVIRHFPGKKYEFRVYELRTLQNDYHLNSFESFQEAWEYITKELWG